MNDQPSPLSSGFNAMKLLDLYIDDQLSAEDRARFEQQLASDATLREMIDRQHQIDRSLSGLFAAPLIPLGLLHQLQPQAGKAAASTNGKPGNGQLTGSRHDAASPDRTRPDVTRADAARSDVTRPDSIRLESHPRFEPAARSGGYRWRWKTVAAVLFFLLCGSFGSWQSWEVYHEGRSNLVVQSPKLQPFEVAFDNEVAAGFQTLTACHPTDGDADNTFGHAVTQQFKEPIAMHAPPENVTLVGFKFSPTMSQYTVALLAKVSDQPVMLFADLAARDHAEYKLRSAGTRMNEFKRTIGSVVVYEITPLEKPTLLKLLYTP